VTLTAALDGPESPIHKALARIDAGDDTSREKITSLADRVRALQKAASAN